MKQKDKSPWTAYLGWFISGLLLGWFSHYLRG